MNELEETKKLRNALVWELNELQQKHTENPYNEKTIWQLMYTREKLNKLTKKINTMEFKDKKRD